MRHARLLLAATLLAASVACGDDSGDPPPGGGNVGGWGINLTPDAGRQVRTVDMISDGEGYRFEPASITVQRGDVIRFRAVSGIHNVHFVADSNPSLAGLPQVPSVLLDDVGQTLDTKVGAAAGSYYYQCDPHAFLGMTGTVTVQ